MLRLRSIVWLVSCWLLAAAAAALTLGEQSGRFGFQVEVEGETLQGSFGHFTVMPRTGADGLPVGFLVEVDLRHAATGIADVDAELLAPAWLDVATHPVARFQADGVAPGPSGELATRGVLTLKGVTRPLTVAFGWRRVEGMQVLSGTATLDRRQFGVGPDDDSAVAAIVRVAFDLRWRSDGG